MPARTNAVVLLCGALAIGCDRVAGPTVPATAASTQAGSTSQAADRLDVIEAVFRHMFEHSGSGGRRDFDCFFMTVDDGADAPPELLTRFGGETPKVLPGSMADRSPDGGVRQKGSDGRAMSLHAGPVTWLDANTAEVSGGWYVGHLNSAGYTYRVTRVNKKWTVTSSRMVYVS